MCIKPPLKWVGGKSQIINDLLRYFPKNINNYHEIFLGGGSVLLAVLQNSTISGTVYASDINLSLISFYQNLQQDPVKLYNLVKEIKDDYYAIRTEFNNCVDKTCFRASALFIYLNKTCFRGLYRTNSKGLFNVPYGNYKNPEIVNLEHLQQISELIKDVKFQCLDFTDSLKLVKDGDFVYLDPPYINTFVGYDKTGFNVHEKFFTLTKNLPCKFVMSNTNDISVIETFKNYSIKTIECKRAINSKHPESKALEVIIIPKSVIK